MTQSQVAQFIDLFRNGDRDVAFFGLLETQSCDLASLIEAYSLEPDSEIRAFLVEAVWQRRDNCATQFLSQALEDRASEVWKAAIDGLVTLATPDAVRALESTRCRQCVRDAVQSEFCEWIDEALQQLKQID